MHYNVNNPLINHPSKSMEMMDMIDNFTLNKLLRRKVIVHREEIKERKKIPYAMHHSKYECIIFKDESVLHPERIIKMHNV